MPALKIGPRVSRGPWTTRKAVHGPRMQVRSDGLEGGVPPAANQARLERARLLGGVAARPDEVGELAELRARRLGGVPLVAQAGEGSLDRPVAFEARERPGALRGRDLEGARDLQ